MKNKLAAFAIVPISILMPLLSAKPSLAELKVRNDSPNKMQIAIGHKMHQSLDCCNGSEYADSVCKKGCRSWVSTGWHTVNPGEERTILNRDLRYNNHYYYYASSVDRNGRLLEWKGNTPFCVSSRAFKIFQNSPRDCSRRENFREFKTGEYKDFTLTLH